MSAPDYPNQPNASTGTESDVGRIAETARADVADAVEEVKQNAAALGEEAKAQLEEATRKAKGMADEQKSLLVGQIGGVSDALNKVADELETKGDASGGYVRFIADGASNLTNAIKDNDVDDLIAMAQDFGRKQPVAFLGAAALLGFAASRFVLASASRKTAQTESTFVRSEPSPTYGTSGGGNNVDY
jgi:hypothetical protein